MDSKFWIATVVGFVALFLSGYVIWGVALAGWMAENLDQSLAIDPPIWAWLIGSNLIWAMMIAYVFSRWAGVSTWKGGARVGAILAFFISASFATGQMSMTTVYTGGILAMLVDIVSTTLWSAIGGAAIGAMLGRDSE